VQVTFDPEVLAVFATLNRMVFQSARRRLLSTLCYALIDPAKHQLVFASAGHVFPYRVGQGGKVEALESIAYPLGVRKTLTIQVRHHEIVPGDSLFLFSDGLVEASREGDDEPFGFERLEKSLAHHAGKSVSQLRDAVIGDVRAFTRYAPQTDDLTVLVLRLPAAA
jgi:sigma-B regulation protein RsbU (phosphoserine phosphatase)